MTYHLMILKTFHVDFCFLLCVFSSVCFMSFYLNGMRSHIVVCFAELILHVPWCNAKCQVSSMFSSSVCRSEVNEEWWCHTSPPSPDSSQVWLHTELYSITLVFCHPPPLVYGAVMMTKSPQNFTSTSSSTWERLCRADSRKRRRGSSKLARISRSLSFSGVRVQHEVGFMMGVCWTASKETSTV